MCRPCSSPRPDTRALTHLRLRFALGARDEAEHDMLLLVAIHHHANLGGGLRGAARAVGQRKAARTLGSLQRTAVLWPKSPAPMPAVVATACAGARLVGAACARRTKPFKHALCRCKRGGGGDGGGGGGEGTLGTSYLRASKLSCTMRSRSAMKSASSRATLRPRSRPRPRNSTCACA